MIPKKSLGQNFFINEHLGEKIANIVLEEKPKTVVEIGSGRGFFTGKIHKEVPTVICIEKDNNLAQGLGDTDKTLTIYNEDFLDFDMRKLPTDILFFGSLPYNISKPIIRKIITSKHFTRPAFFIIQKEVAEKYIAKEPDNNLLSLTTQIYALPKKLFNINSGAFRPKPKVTSALIKFTPIEKISVEKEFEGFLKTAFVSPRKTLKNNLRVKDITPLLLKRPSELTLDEYVKLFHENLL